MTDTVTTSALRTLGAIYEETRQRVVNLVREASYVDFFAASAPTPACPGWRVRDVIAHLSGLATDIASGNLAGQATAAWTAAQVDARRNMPLIDLLAESDEVGPQLASYLDDFPGRYGAQVAADITVHEHDIRGGLGQPGARDSAGVAHGIELLLTTFVGPGARALGLPTLHIRAGQRGTAVGGYAHEATDPTAAIQSARATGTAPPDAAGAPAATAPLPRAQ